MGKVAKGLGYEGRGPGALFGAIGYFFEMVIEYFDEVIFGHPFGKGECDGLMVDGLAIAAFVFDFEGDVVGASICGFVVIESTEAGESTKQSGPKWHYPLGHHFNSL